MEHTKREPVYIYELTEFYCEICKAWHRKNERIFHEHINLFKSHYAFKVEKGQEVK